MKCDVKRFPASYRGGHLDWLTLDADYRLRETQRMQRELMRKDMVIQEIESEISLLRKKLETLEIENEKLSGEVSTLKDLSWISSLDYEI